jgi:hypothetical protein
MKMPSSSMAFSSVMMMPSLASIRMDEQRRWITVTATGLLRRYDGFSITVNLNGSIVTACVCVFCTLVHSPSCAKLAVGDCI